MTLDALMFTLYAALALGMFITCIYWTRRGRKVKVTDTIIPAIVLISLVYDNFMLGFGGQLFEQGDLFENLSIPRYYLHGLLTPLLILHLALSGDRMNLPGYRSRTVLTLWGFTTFIAIFLGISSELDLRLEYVVKEGVAGYSLAKAGGPPLAEIITVFSMLVIGMAMQRYARWPWAMLGSASILVIVVLWLDNSVAVNLGELMLLAGSTATGAYAVVCTERERADKKAAALAKRKSRSTAGADGVSSAQR
jgi:hypothetical protein